MKLTTNDKVITISRVNKHLIFHDFFLFTKFFLFFVVIVNRCLT